MEEKLIKQLQADDPEELAQALRKIEKLLETRDDDGVTEMLSRKHFAKRMDVSLRQVDNWLRDGVIPHFKFGRKCVRIPIKPADEALRDFLVWSE